MPRLTITLPDDLNDRLEELSGDDGPFDSKADAVRELTRRGDRLEEVEAERDNLRRQLAAVNAREDDVDALATYVEDELEYRRAGLSTRLRWFLFGKD